MVNVNRPTPVTSPTDLEGVDNANKDREVIVGALRIGNDTLLTPTEAALLDALAASSGAAGTAAAGTAEEHILGDWHFTKLTLSAFALGDSGDNAAAAIGALLYTLPAGNIYVEDASIVGAVTIDDAVQTDTPELGLGTTVGSGANATLGDVDAACENIAGPFVLTSVDGTDTEDGGVTATALQINAADDHTIYMNIADTWADLTDVAALTFTGTVTIKWRLLS